MHNYQVQSQLDALNRRVATLEAALSLIFAALTTASIVFTVYTIANSW